MFRPLTAVDREVLSIWCDATPADAFIAGRTETAGKLFIPSNENIELLRARIANAQKHCKTESQLKILGAMDTFLGIFEPCHVPDFALNAFSGYMIKEGIRPGHLMGLADHTKASFIAYMRSRKNIEVPIGQRLLAEINCDGLLEVLNVVVSNTKSKSLKAKVNELRGTVNEFEKQVHVDGYSNGTFDEVWHIIRGRGCALDREILYAQALRGLFDYSESPFEVEQKGLRFLYDEIGDFNKLVQELANKLGCEARSEIVTKTIRAKKSLKPSRIIPYINQIRRLVIKIVNTRVVGVNPKYLTHVLETPSYLTGILPSGAAWFINYLTPNPKQIFMATVDPKRDPSSVPSELVNLLIHEEYGHCLHGSNSARGYAAKPAFVEMLTSSLGNAVSEGISFQRELEFLEYLNEAQSGRKLDLAERKFEKSFARLGGFEEFCQEYEFFTKAWRMTRFLRVIGDARINSGKQDLADFIEWAHKETGLSRSMIYFQVFPAHQGIAPGYASTYAIIGESIREIQTAARNRNVSLLELNTYASSLGFPSRTVFENRLREFEG